MGFYIKKGEYKIEIDEVYNAICKKYEDELGNPLSKDAVFWSVSYEIALKNYKAVKQMWDDELKD